jgi:Tol biopolymer transport system component
LLDLEELKEDVLIPLPIAARDKSPTFSGSGSHVAFERYYEEGAGLSVAQIWVSTTDGSDQMQVSLCGGTHPSYSAVGSRLVYVKRNFVNTPEDGVLWIADIEHRMERQLTFHPECSGSP